MNLDEYISQTISNIKLTKNDIDEFTLSTDLKEYVLNSAENISKVENLNLNDAVVKFLSSLGTPEQFANTILKEINHETKYLLVKILLASLLAFGPFIIILLSFLKIL